MQDLNYDLKQLCSRNRDGSFATQAGRERILTLVANQLRQLGFVNMQTKEDTAAAALVLDEFGETYKDNDDPYDLKLEYHVRIKILKRAGLEEANVSVPIQVGASEDSKEKVTRIKASTYNVVNGSIKETPMSEKVIFRDNRTKYWDVIKFTLPDVTVGDRKSTRLNSSHT